MKKVFLLSLSLVLFSLVSFAQTERTIKGSVWGHSQGSPSTCRLVGASVLQNGTHRGAVTDSDGLFTLKLQSQPGTTTITAYYLGYTPETKTVGSALYYNFILEEETFGTIDSSASITSDKYKEEQ